MRLLLLLSTVSLVAGFVPQGGRTTASRNSIFMKLSDDAVGLVGTDIEYPEFDPWGLTKGADADKIAWYRAAELKHGRVAMLASLGQITQVKDGAAPGDLGFDPLGLRSDDLELWEKTQLRELKNGRLAMLAIAGMFYTEWITGNGVLEAWKIGAVSPFNDGIGIF